MVSRVEGRQRRPFSPDASSQPITPHGAMFTAGAVVASSSAGTGRHSLD
jgi:hypothetical protein